MDKGRSKRVLKIYYNMVTGDDRRSSDGIEMKLQLMEIYRGECFNRGMSMETNDCEDTTTNDWGIANVVQN